jgi:1,4-alpha-glucan branching enzyme
MHDSLSFFSHDPVYRKHHINQLTFSLLYAFSENYILPLSHDEVVHGKGSLLGKMPGDFWQKRANLRLLFGWQFGHPGKKLLFMGGEFGQWDEWDCAGTLSWGLLKHEEYRAIARLVKDLNALYQKEKALYENDRSYKTFQWIDFSDVDSSVISFIRWDEKKNRFLVFVFNFTPVVRSSYRIGVPRPGIYREILNSDSAYYGGSNTGNLGLLKSTGQSAHGLPDSVELTLPPLGFLVFSPVDR